MCLNTPSKPKTRISTNPSGLADFSLYPLHCRILQSSPTHPPLPLHTTPVPSDRTRLPTSGGYIHTSATQRTPQGTAGAQRPHVRTRHTCRTRCCPPPPPPLPQHTCCRATSPPGSRAGRGSAGAMPRAGQAAVGVLPAALGAELCLHPKGGSGMRWVLTCRGGSLAGKGSGRTCHRSGSFGQRGWRWFCL